MAPFSRLLVIWSPALGSLFSWILIYYFVITLIEKMILREYKDFISKPFVPSVIRSRVNRTLELEEYRSMLVEKLDKKTKEVIKELPPEKTLDMIAKVWEIAGLMVDEQR